MLFSNADLNVNPVNSFNVKNDKKKAEAITADCGYFFASTEKLNLIEKTLGELSPGKSCFFRTDGAWSNIHLLEFLLSKSGPADVYFSTCSISSEAITRFADWQKSGLIKNLYVVLDAGIRNRKPEIYQQSTGAFSNLKVTACHAKVTAIIGEKHHFTLMGSANYTRNPRIEAGVIVWDKSLANQNAAWIKEIINE